MSKITLKTMDDSEDDDYHTMALDRLGLPKQLWIDGYGVYLHAVKIELACKPINGETEEPIVEAESKPNPDLFDFADEMKKRLGIDDDV